MKKTKKNIWREEKLKEFYGKLPDPIPYDKPTSIKIKDGLLYKALGWEKEYRTPENIRGLRKTHWVAFSGVLETLYLTKNIQEVYPLSLHWYLISLQNILVDPENEYYCDIDGVLFTKNKKKLVAFPEGRLGDKYVIPEGTEVIGENAFMHAGITEVVMPSTLKKIEPNAFEDADICICDFSNTTHNRLSAKCFSGCNPTYVIRNKKMILEDVYTQQGNWGYKSCFFVTPDKKEEVYKKVFIED